MNNGFNVCPHCGKANSLNARFCSGCGRQLSVPDEVVICPKCHKPNSPLAGFCGQCGAPLKAGSPTKTCPRCGNAVDISENVCSCGYNFAATTSAPSKPKHKLPYKGGRIFAVIALVFLLAFAYFIFAPQQYRPDFLVNFDKGLFENVTGSEYQYMYGLDTGIYIAQVYGEVGSETFELLKLAFDISGLMIVGLVALTAVCIVFHVLSCIIRLFTGKRSKHKNGLYLLLAIISSLWAVLWAICFYLIPASSEGFLLQVRQFFVPTLQTGWVMLAIPVYYWFFYFYSGIVKVHKIKEKMA